MATKKKKRTTKRARASARAKRAPRSASGRFKKKRK